MSSEFKWKDYKVFPDKEEDENYLKKMLLEQSLSGSLIDVLLEKHERLQCYNDSIHLLNPNLQRVDKKLEVERERSCLYSKILESFEFPIAFISHSAEVVSCNKAFLSLAISSETVLKLEDEDFWEGENSSYVVYRVALKNGESFVFYPRNQKEVSSGLNELGIVASSLAHELNNPLGGIKMALGLFNDCPEDILGEMSQVVDRCLSLIQIFLGFARKRPMKGKSASIDLKDAFGKAYDLTRFRAMEMQCQLEVSKDLKQETPVKNLSVLTMCFYLVLSKLLTVFSRKNLLDMKNKNRLSLEIISEEDGIEFYSDLIFDRDWKNEGLLRQLLTTLGMKLVIRRGGLRFDLE